MTPEEVAEFERPTREKYEAEGNPYYATARLWDDGVLDPAETRAALALALSAAYNAPIPETRVRRLPDVSAAVLGSSRRGLFGLLLATVAARRPPRPRRRAPSRARRTPSRHALGAGSRSSRPGPFAGTIALNGSAAELPSRARSRTRAAGCGCRSPCATPTFRPTGPTASGRTGSRTACAGVGGPAPRGVDGHAAVEGRRGRGRPRHGRRLRRARRRRADATSRSSRARRGARSRCATRSRFRSRSPRRDVPALRRRPGGRARARRSGLILHPAQKNVLDASDRDRPRRAPLGGGRRRASRAARSRCS